MPAHIVEGDPVGEKSDGRKIEAGRIKLCDEGFEPQAAFGEGQGAQVLLSLLQQVVATHEHRKALAHLR